MDVVHGFSAVHVHWKFSRASLSRRRDPSTPASSATDVDNMRFLRFRYASPIKRAASITFSIVFTPV